MGVPIAIVTDMQNIIYPENQLGGVGTAVKNTSNILTAGLLLQNNSFKSISCKGVFYKLFGLVNIFLLMGIFETHAQQNASYTLYANIVYRFTKYINWPDDKKSGDFIIGIVGDSPLYEEIKRFTANKTVGSRKIVIKIFSNSLASYDCHILFISEEESHSLKKIARVTDRTATLLLSESGGLARKGSCINFIIVDEHLKLEINKTNIEDRHLHIASELLSLGIIIK